MADASYPLAIDASAQIQGGALSLGPLLTKSGSAQAHAGRDKVTADATAVGNVVGSSLLPLVSFGNATATNDLSFDDKGTLTATAIAAITDLNVLGALHIDSIEARSISHANADGTKSNEVALDIGGASLAGTPITIGNDGLTLGGPPSGGDVLSKLGKTLSPLLSAFRGQVRTLGKSDLVDDGGASGNVTGLAIDLFPNIDQAAGVSPTITVLIGFAGSHAYTFQAPAPAAKSGSTGAGGTSGTSGSAGTPGTPGTPSVAIPGAPGTGGGVGSTIEEVVSSLLAGAAASRLKFFYLAWTLSMIGLAFGSRLRPARLNGGVNRAGT
jgi:hypothetical protein